MHTRGVSVHARVFLNNVAASNDPDEVYPQVDSQESIIRLFHAHFDHSIYAKHKITTNNLADFQLLRITERNEARKSSVIRFSPTYRVNKDIKDIKVIKVNKMARVLAELQDFFNVDVVLATNAVGTLVDTEMETMNLKKVRSTYKAYIMKKYETSNLANDGSNGGVFLRTKYMSSDDAAKEQTRLSSAFVVNTEVSEVDIPTRDDTITVSSNNRVRFSHSRAIEAVTDESFEKTVQALISRSDLSTENVVIVVNPKDFQEIDSLITRYHQPLRLNLNDDKIKKQNVNVEFQVSASKLVTNQEAAAYDLKAELPDDDDDNFDDMGF
eukprot:Platyproteum_vivax@DN10256_c0_g1_i1.p1